MCYSIVKIAGVRYNEDKVQKDFESLNTIHFDDRKAVRDAVHEAGRVDAFTHISLDKIVPSLVKETF